MIQLKNVKKYYQMGETIVKALDDVSLNIKKNDFVAVMGPSGSGKSTLMNIIGCLDTPSSGTYILNGKEVNSLDDDEMAKIRNSNLGFIFQNFNLLPRLNAIKNVALPLLYSSNNKNIYIKKAVESLEMVGLKDRIYHKPSELSGGQSQRVAIARALINDPSIILADEPTGNLDSATSEDIMKLLQKLHKKGHTIIMVTHEKDVAKYADYEIQMIDGKVINGI
jgi:putative ABC transport system ATP-binding protein